MFLPGWLFYGAAEFVNRHSSDVFLVSREQFPQWVKTGAVSVKIGPKNDDYYCFTSRLACGCGQVPDKNLLLRFAAA
jgi:hypothetical protein